LATKTTLYWVTGFAYRSVISTLKTPPIVAIDATQPLDPAKTTVPAWDWPGLIGSVSLPTWPGAAGGVHSGPAVVEVVTAAAAVDVLEAEVELEEELVELDEDTWSAAPIGWRGKFLS